MATRDPNQPRPDADQRTAEQRRTADEEQRRTAEQRPRTIGGREVRAAGGTPTSTPQTPNPADKRDDPVLSGQGSVDTRNATAGGVATLQPVPGTGNVTMVGAPAGTTAGAAAPAGAAPAGAMTTANTGGIAPTGGTRGT